MTEISPQHIVIFEPSLEGHHISWLRYVTEDLLSVGHQVTWAVDTGPAARELLKSNLAELLPQVSVIPVFHEGGIFPGESMIQALVHCLDESGAQEVFLINLDHIASPCLRRAALGIMPPKALQGRLSGVYFRPRFLANPAWPPGNILKAAGFHKLCRQRWFKHIFLMDEALCLVAKESYAGPAFHLLPDPWDGDFSRGQPEARAALGIPGDRYVLLHYGIGDRRKGLHLTIRAFLESSPDERLFLLCAGKISQDRDILNKLLILERRGMALVLNHYVSDAEEGLCFSASDAVLLTYIKHFGSSGVLSLAAAAGKMVIASEEGLVGRRVREHNLGLLFPSGNVAELRKCMAQAVLLAAADRESFRAAALAYAVLCSREAFRNVLIDALGVPKGAADMANSTK